MRVILQVTSGPAEGRRIPLQSGEVARFGGSDTADVCFPHDGQMAGVHFLLECHADRCLLRDLQSGQGTLLNGQPVEEASLCGGDVILAGQTSLMATLEGAASPQLVGEPKPDESDPAAVSEPPPRTLPELCALLELGEESKELLQPEHTLPTFVQTLIGQQRFADAIRLLSFHLPKPQAVWWAYSSVKDCLGRDFLPAEQEVMDAVLVWLQEPGDDHRRAAMKAAEIAEFQSAPSWVGLAAFWSDGSLAPEGLPEVKPDERLTSQGVTAALMMVATQGDPRQSRDKYERMLKVGQDVLQGKHPMPG
ncbi:MAG: FHA domain-containing protein [Planctomycetales bacterium]|nr:FHA domain-containing protein [Planctomycetales bacterium]